MMLTYYKFSEDELNCPCCGKLNVSKQFMDKIIAARLIADIPFCVNSCYRCKRHNTEVGGSNNSAHLDGEAMDIKAETSRKRFVIIFALIMTGFNRIGVGKNFIHVDASTDPNKDSEVIWLY